jgi:dTDP-4-amino-4,6-dideoxygalactose transaminase
MLDPVRFQHPQLPSSARIERYFSLARDRRWFANGGPCHSLLTEGLEEFLGNGAHVVLMANATLGLMLTLRSLLGDRQQGRFVLVPSFTFPATAQAIRWTGLEPLWVDVEPKGWHLDPFALREALSANRGNIGAVLACSTFGTAPPVDQSAEWADICAAAEVPLLLDSAPGFGSRDTKGRLLGTQGNAEVFSFHATKPFAIGEGCAVTTLNAELAVHLTEMTNFAFEEDREIRNPFGLNAKLSEIHAAIGLAVLDSFDSILTARSERAEHMRGKLQQAGYQFQIGSQNSSWQFVPVLAPSRSVREAVLTRSDDQGIEIRCYHTPLHQLPAFAAHPSYRDLSVTEELASRMLSLPLANDLSESAMSRITDLLQECALSHSQLARTAT